MGFQAGSGELNARLGILANQPTDKLYGYISAPKTTMLGRVCKMGTILLVDDYQDTVDLYALVLIGKGYTFLVATNIPQARGCAGHS